MSSAQTRPTAAMTLMDRVSADTIRAMDPSSAIVMTGTDDVAARDLERDALGQGVDLDLVTVCSRAREEYDELRRVERLTSEHLDTAKNPI